MPFTSPIHTAGILRQFSASSSVWNFEVWRGVKFHSGADLPLEVVPGLYYWWIEPVWMDKLAAQSGGVSIIQIDNYTGPLFNLIQRNVPQSKVTWPNNNNVVNVTVFGNYIYLYAVRIEASVLLSVLLPVLPSLLHISDRKTVSVTSKKL